MEKYFLNSIEWLNRAQRIAGIGIWNQEIKDNKLWWSDETYRVFEMKPQSEEMNFDKFLEMVHPDDKDAVVSENRRLFETHKNPYKVEYKITTKKGKTKILYEEASIEFDSDNNPERIIGIIKDITKQRENEAKLIEAKEKAEESEITFRKLFEDSSDAILLIDSDGVFVECNNAALCLLKMTREDFLFHSPANISPEYQPNNRKSEEAAVEMIELAYKKGLHRFDWTCINSHGEEFIVEVSLMPILIKGQRMLHTTWRDITDRKGAELNLKKNEQMLKTILDGFVDDIYITNSNFEIEYVNKALQKKIGNDKVGQKCYKGKYGLDKKCGWCIYEKLNVKNSIITYDLKVPNSEEYCTARNILLENGSKLSVFYDITERKKMEQELVKSEEKFSAIFQNSPNPFSISNLEDGVIQDVNESFTKIFGFTKSDVKNKSSIDLGVWVNKKDREQAVIELKKNGFLRNFSVKLRTKTGTEVDIIASGSIIKIGNSMMLVNEYMDVTSLKKTEQALIDSENIFKSITDSAHDAIILMNNSGKVEFWNKAAERIFGYSDKEVLHKNLHEIITPEKYREVANNAFKDFKKSGKGNAINKTLEIEAVRKGGEIFPIELSLSAIKINGLWNAIGLVKDITIRKNTETNLQESQAKLQHSNKMKDKFFSIIAHELKSPFTSMLGFSKMLDEKFDNFNTEKKKKFISIINKNTQNTFKLLENLLLWSQSQRGIIDYKPEPINLYLLSNEANEILHQALENKTIKLVNRIQENIHINVDENMISTVVRNLISNAIKFTPNGGEIILLSVKKQKSITVTVRDNGIGISRENQSKLFDISECNTTLGTENERGTGLGLILCKEFIDRHDGEIWVESEEGKGSSFNFTIPYKSE